MASTRLATWVIAAGWTRARIRLGVAFPIVFIGYRTPFGVAFRYTGRGRPRGGPPPFLPAASRTWCVVRSGLEPDRTVPGPVVLRVVVVVGPSVVGRVLHGVVRRAGPGRLVGFVAVAVLPLQRLRGVLVLPARL